MIKAIRTMSCKIKRILSIMTFILLLLRVQAQDNYVNYNYTYLDNIKTVQFHVEGLGRCVSTAWSCMMRCIGRYGRLQSHTIHLSSVLQ